MMKGSMNILLFGVVMYLLLIAIVLMDKREVDQRFYDCMAVRNDPEACWNTEVLKK